MKEREVLKLALKALENNKQDHRYCEDTWYSCPKHEDGCANEAEGDECNCGADEINAQFDKAITAIEEVLAQPEQEPVGEVSKAEFGDYPVICWRKGYVAKIGDKFYTTPPQRKPLTDEQIRQIMQSLGWTGEAPSDIEFARAIEAAHGIKE